MKQCKVCGSTYDDRVDFCFRDGTPLAGFVASPAGASSAVESDPGVEVPPVTEEMDAPVPMAMLRSTRAQGARPFGPAPDLGSSLIEETDAPSPPLPVELDAPGPTPDPPMEESDPSLLPGPLPGHVPWLARREEEDDEATLTGIAAPPPATVNLASRAPGPLPAEEELEAPVALEPVRASPEVTEEPSGPVASGAASPAVSMPPPLLHPETLSGPEPTLPPAAADDDSAAPSLAELEARTEASPAKRPSKAPVGVAVAVGVAVLIAVGVFAMLDRGGPAPEADPPVAAAPAAPAAPSAPVEDPPPAAPELAAAPVEPAEQAEPDAEPATAESAPPASAATATVATAPAAASAARPAPTAQPAAATTARTAADPTPAASAPVAEPATADASPWGVEPTSAEKGKLTVISAPAGARVFVDDKEVGITPVSTDLDLGLYIVRLELAGHRAISQTLRLKDATASLNFTLDPIPVTGQVNLFGPDGAVVFLGERRLGTVPLSQKLEEGRYDFKVVLPDGSTFTQSRDVRFASPTQPISLQLSGP